MYYPDEVIEQVRSANDIVDVIGSYVKLTKRGGSYMGLCPFHGEKTPSFSVSRDKQLYYCFGCGAGGNVFTFLEQYDNMSFPEAVQALADRAGISLPQAQESAEDKKRRSRRQVLLEVNKLAANYFFYKLKSSEGAPARRYLEERQIRPETIVHFGLGCSPRDRTELYRFLKSRSYSDDVLKDSGLVVYDEKYGAHDRFWNRVMYPILDANSHVIGFGGRVMGDGKPKYLNSPETMIFDKSRNLYGLNFARSARKGYFIVCEGYMDVIAMHQAGFSSAVASLGTAFTQQHAQVLRRYVKDVRLAYDSDGAGQKATMRVIPILKEAGITARVIHMNPYKDPDEFIKKLGRDEFQQRIDDAESSFMYEISVIAEKYRMTDPADRAAFLKSTARRLLEFPEPLERQVYIESISSKYGIESKGLTEMVNRLGSTLSPDQIRDMRGGAGSLPEDDTFADSQAMRLGQGARQGFAGDTRERAKKQKESGLRLSQKLLLTYMIEDVTLFEKLKDEITPDDFTDPLYHRAAVQAFQEYSETGKVTPARIVAGFADPAEQAEAAALFSTKIKGGDDPQTREKAIHDVVNNLKRARKKQALKNTTTMDQLMDAYNQMKKNKT